MSNNDKGENFSQKVKSVPNTSIKISKPFKVIAAFYVVFCIVNFHVFFFNPDSISPSVQEVLFSAIPSWIWSFTWLAGSLLGIMFFIQKTFTFYIASNVAYVFNSTSIFITMLYLKLFSGGLFSFIAVYQWFLVSIIPAILLSSHYSMENNEESNDRAE